MSLDSINNLPSIYLCYAMEGIIYCQPLVTRLKILLNVMSSIIKADQPPFLGRRKGTAGRRKPPQGAALISMRERRARIGRKAYVHSVTYAIPVL